MPGGRREGRLMADSNEIPVAGKPKIDWKHKLTSRKLWMSIASFAALLAVAFGVPQATATQITALIMAGATVIGYIFGEGLIDAASAGAQAAAANAVQDAQAGQSAEGTQA